VDWFGRCALRELTRLILADPLDSPYDTAISKLIMRQLGLDRATTSYSLATAMALILLLPAQAFGSSNNLDTSSIEIMVIQFTLSWPASDLRYSAKASVIDVSLGFLQLPFDTSDEVEIMIDPGGGGQLRLFHIFSGISLSGTQRSLLVSLVTW